MARNKTIHIAITIMAIVLVASLSSCTTKAQKELDTLIEYSNQQMPMVIDEYTVCTALVQESDYVVYDYQIEGGNDMMESISSTEAQRKNLVLEQLANSDFRDFVQTVTATGRGIGYRYHDAHSSRVVEIMVPCAQLDKALEESRKLHP
ncbi:MAG: hypothetical protein KBT13_02360 [Bacteroidales bacterium]|nr:hypothetical protein [Candidatus Sodaliphilus limicaballi]